MTIFSVLEEYEINSLWMIVSIPPRSLRHILPRQCFPIVTGFFVNLL